MSIKKSSKRKKSQTQLKSPGLTGWAVIFLSIFIAVFLISMFWPQAEVKVEQPVPKIIRLQFLNGCGKSGAAEKMAKAFMNLSSDIIFDVIDKGNAKLENFNKTMVLDRRGDPQHPGNYSQAALYTARFLAADKDRIIIQKMADNLLDIDVTVIVGNDYPDLLDKLHKEVN